MSVGHVARIIEQTGIPTVVIMVTAFRHVAGEMGLPRVVLTRHPMGRPLGAPFDGARHREVVEAALELLEAAPSGGWVVELPGRYRPARPSPGGPG